MASSIEREQIQECIETIQANILKTEESLSWLVQQMATCKPMSSFLHFDEIVFLKATIVSLTADLKREIIKLG